MKLLQFAVASLVDANTGFGLEHANGRIDYAAAERRGRAIRSKSVAALLAAIKSRLGKTVSAYVESQRRQAGVRKLRKLNDHLLKDIGIERHDLAAIELGQLSFEEARDSAIGDGAEKIAEHTVVKPNAVVEQSLTAVNQENYAEAKCA